MLHFDPYQLNRIPLFEAIYGKMSESFDLVYSKGVLNHVADKDSLFKQINSVLKPNRL